MTKSNMDPRADVLSIITGTWAAQCLYAAVRLQIPDAIADGADTLSEIAERSNTKPHLIGRLMHVLIHHGVFEFDAGSKSYRNTATSRLLTSEGDGLRDLVLFYGDVFHRAWLHLPEALASGRSGFEVEFGNDFYSYLRENGETAAQFSAAMRSSNLIFDEAVPNLKLDFKDVVDVGGGSGELARRMISASPSVRVKLLDVEVVTRTAYPSLQEHVLAGRVELVAGDMMKGLPASGDVYVLSRVLGDLDASSALHLLNECRKAMKPGGSVVIIERVIEDDLPDKLTALWDIHLHVACRGRLRSMREFEALLQSAGMRADRAVRLSFGTAMIFAVAEDRCLS